MFKKITTLIITASMIMVLLIFKGPVLGEVTINYIEVTTIPERYMNEVSVYASVLSANGNPIQGLAMSDYEVFEDGKTVQLDDVTTASDPMFVLLVIDTSGSMRAIDKSGQTAIEAVKKAAIDFISMLDGGDQVALYSFNNSPILQKDFSPDLDNAIEVVRTLSAKKGAATCLYDTAYTVVKKAAEIPRGRRAIILLTDGKDEKGGKRCSVHNLSDVIEAATTKTIRVPVYTIGAGSKVDISELRRISSLTGGRSMQAASFAEVAGFYQSIANQLKNQYLIKYFTRGPSGEHSLALKVMHEGSLEQDERKFWTPPLPVLKPPSVSFLSIKPDFREKAVQVVKIKISPDDNIASVRYYIDGNMKKEKSKSPYDLYLWDTKGLSGLHVLRVEVIDRNGLSGFAEMTSKVEIETLPLATAVKTVDGNQKVKKSKMAWIILVVALVACGLIMVGVLRWKKNDTECMDEDKTELVNQQEDVDDATMFIDDVSHEIPASRALLTVVASVEHVTGEIFEITGSAIIGRSKDSDIEISDKPVSRKHAEIFFEGNSYYIRDLGSINGIKIDGRRIMTNTSSLNDGNQIQLGPKTILEFRCADSGDSFDDEFTKINEL
ncbi:MAG: FHA domain-containing protein [Desulfobacterales bacterium]|nr:FHA domain-containing protein [Desulfobacteraceae bacterium]MBT7084712.1 FHA domain-containing protein [Desulfobacterales bacterium]MBT7697462.1 FHA domain-containing protein [Desulfobacterales bacterium]